MNRSDWIRAECDYDDQRDCASREEAYRKIPNEFRRTAVCLKAILYSCEYYEANIIEDILYNGNQLEHMPIEKHKYARCNTMNIHEKFPNFYFARSQYMIHLRASLKRSRFCARFKIRSQRNAK